MADVFISYAHEDQAFVRLMVPALEAEGLSVWWDHTIPPGQSWDSFIARGIEEAKACIIVWSSHSIASDWVKEEATLAKDASKYLPVQIGADPPPVGFRRIQAANLTGWSGDRNNPQWQMLAHAASAHTRGESAARQAPRPVAAMATAYEPPPAAKSKTGLFVALAGVAVLLLGGGYLLTSADRERSLSTEATDTTLVAQQMEIDRLRRAAADAAAAQQAAEQRAEQAAASATETNPALQAQIEQLRKQAADAAAAQQAAEQRAAKTVGAGEINRAPQQQAQQPQRAAPGPFDLAQLNAAVRNAASAARATQVRCGDARARDKDPSRFDDGTFYGETAGGSWMGCGVYEFKSGDKHVGDWAANNTRSDGVYTFANGSRYEGQFLNLNRVGYDMERDGYGVMWTADGRVAQSGVWSKGTFSSAPDLK